jgi:hypothetical protein
MHDLYGVFLSGVMGFMLALFLVVILSLFGDHFE